MSISTQECITRLEDFVTYFTQLDAEEFIWWYLLQVLNSEVSDSWQKKDYYNFFDFSSILVRAIRNLFIIKKALIEAALNETKIRISTEEYNLTVEELSDSYGEDRVIEKLNEFSAALSKMKFGNIQSRQKAEFLFAAKQFARVVESFLLLASQVYDSNIDDTES